VLDREQRIVYVNPAWLRLRDLEGVDVVGRLAAEVASGEGAPPELLGKIAATLAAHRPWMGTVTSKRQDGHVRELELSISPVFNDRGEIEHFVELARDATERRATEAAMQRSERLASLGMLAAGMAHEINNPMTYVMANLEHLNELVQEGSLTAAAAAELDLAQCLDDSIHGVRRVVEIVADLQALSRQRQDGNEGKASALQTLETCVRMAQSQLRHRAEVARDFPVEDVWLSINPQRLGQVLLNLILNAAQAMPVGSAAGNKLTLRVSARADGRGEIAVQDTGSGITPEVLPRIFDPFFTTKGTGGGTGLGLPISHSIITAAKGEILVESEPGKGTCFRVVLPLATLAPAATPTAGAALRGLSVLVVDDEPGVLTAIRRMLASCRTTTVTSAAEALEKIEREHFDLVLSDVMMAEQSGVELVQALRDSKPELARRVCLMSAGVIGGELMQEVKSIGVPLLHKPMTSQELHQTLWRVHQGEA
jgi:two-component system, NtrC family, sensor kinase